jgi:dTDP-4-amino-4,6-dideoxygalactose transaminase
LKVKYYNDEIGFNSYLDEMQDAFLCVKLKYLNKWNKLRTEMVSFYLESLIDLPGLTLPYVSEWASPIWRIFPVLHSKRDDFQNYLKHKGINTMIHYPVPLHLSKAYFNLGFRQGDSPIAEAIANSELSLPIGPHLNLDNAEYIVDAIRSYK